MLTAPSQPAMAGRCEERPLSILHRLASANSLSSLRRASGPSGPYTVLTLPVDWLARILSYLCPHEKLTEVCRVSSALHRSVVSLSSAFRDDFISFASSPLPPLLAASPWFRGVSGVSVRGSGLDPFQLEPEPEPEPEDEAEAEEQQQTATEPSEVPDRSHASEAAVRRSPSIASPRRPLLLSSSSPSSSRSSPLSWPFSAIRSLSISLSLDSSSPAVRSPPPSLLSSLSRWSNLRHLHIVADDTDDWLTAANLNSGLLTAQPFSPFLLLSRLLSLTLDATVTAEQVAVLAGMEALQCLLLTEREQRAGVDEDRWQREEERMMAALSQVSRLVRRGKGLTQLRMPSFHFPVSADDFCESLSEARSDASPSPMCVLSVQGALSRRGMAALVSLPLSSLKLGWGCELDADERTFLSMPHCRELQHLQVRLTDPHEQDEHDEETYVPRLPALSCVLATRSLTALSLHLPVSGWTVEQSCALSRLPQLRRLTLAGEASGISVRHPLTFDKLVPLVTADESGKLPLRHLHSLTLDWLPVLDDAMLVIAQLSELTSLSLLNCPYLSSFLFCILTALPTLVKLKVYRCDVSLTEKGWRDAQKVMQEFQHSPPVGCLPLVAEQHSSFPRLQVLECHLVHRLSCDVDAAGFSHFLSLLPPRHLHTFDFDSDYSTLPLFVQLAAFPHLRSLGSLSVDVSPLDTELVLAAKRSMSTVLACYYDRQYTRIERGERSRWRSRRRSSTAATSDAHSATKAGSGRGVSGSRETEQGDDEEQQVLQEEGDEEEDELDAERDSSSSSSVQWRDREERWCTQPRGVQFRHREAREAFFERLVELNNEERLRSADSQSLHMEAAVAQWSATKRGAPAATETDSEEDDSGSGSTELDSSPQNAQQTEDSSATSTGWEESDGDEWSELRDGEEVAADEEQQAEEPADADDCCEWEWSQPAWSSSSSSSSPSSSSLSVSLVGRSSKLHSRRYKRDEINATRLKASLPHAVDKSVRRRDSGSGAGLRLAGLVGQRKWEYAASLH